MASTRTATDTMQAFVIKGVGEVAVVEKPIPEPNPNQAVVRSTAALTLKKEMPIDNRNISGIYKARRLSDGIYAPLRAR